MLFLTLLVQVDLVVDVPVGADELLDAGVVGGQRQKVVQDAQLGRVEEGQARVHLNRDSHFTQNKNEKNFCSHLYFEPVLVRIRGGLGRENLTFVAVQGQ